MTSDAQELADFKCWPVPYPIDPEVDDPATQQWLIPAEHPYLKFLRPSIFNARGAWGVKFRTFDGINQLYECDGEAEARRLARAAMIGPHVWDGTATEVADYSRFWRVLVEGISA